MATVAATYVFVVEVDDPSDINAVAEAVEECIGSTFGTLDEPTEIKVLED